MVAGSDPQPRQQLSKLSKNTEPGKLSKPSKPDKLGKVVKLSNIEAS